MKYIDYTWPYMISQLFEYFAIITLQKQPGYIEGFLSTSDLEKYNLNMRSIDSHGFFLLNTEATWYLFITSIITHLIVSLINSRIVTGKPKESELNLIQKQIVKKKEQFEWNGLIRELTIYQIQLVLFALLQVSRIHFSSPIEIISALLAIVILVCYPVFYVWLLKADVKPPESKYITVNETRGVFQQIKKNHRLYITVNPLRKTF